MKSWQVISRFADRLQCGGSIPIGWEQDCTLLDLPYYCITVQGTDGTCTIGVDDGSIYLVGSYVWSTSPEKTPQLIHERFSRLVPQQMSLFEIQNKDPVAYRIQGGWSTYGDAAHVGNKGSLPSVKPTRGKKLSDPLLQVVFDNISFPQMMEDLWIGETPWVLRYIH